ncbi:hypothetical protein QF001_000813 [Paraburkholderia youngii]
MMGPADCRSEVVNTKGLVEKRNVVVADGQTINEPLVLLCHIISYAAYYHTGRMSSLHEP